MKYPYLKTQKHKDNYTAALLKAQETRPCKWCSEQFSSGNIVLHEGKCLHAPSNRIECPQCSAQILKRGKRFCNSKCAAIYNNTKREWTDERRRIQAEKVSIALTGRPSPRKGTRTVEPEDRQCVQCLSTFKAARWRPTKLCSPRCVAIHNAEKPRSWGRKSCIPYLCPLLNKEVILESTWELEIAQFLDEHAIAWTRPDPLAWFDANGKEHFYFPDFWLVDTGIYLDPKNPRVIEKDQIKLAAISTSHDLIYGSPEYIRSQIKERVLKLVE